MSYTITRPHRWIITVHENGEYYGTIVNKTTNRVKWFRTRENTLKWIKKNLSNPNEGVEFIPEIDDERELVTIQENEE